LWRQKEQFSDGVGYNWIDSLVNHCGKIISDAEVSLFKMFSILSQI
jgi:asparagine synthase (glutamine-hydrolysing)